MNHPSRNSRRRRKAALMGGLTLAVSAAGALPSSTWANAAAAPTSLSAASVAPREARAPGWHRYVPGPRRTLVRPTAVAETRGDVRGARSVLRPNGSATLTTVEGQAPASILLDFGQEVGGTPYIDVAGADSGAELNLVTSEARQYIRRGASTTVAEQAERGAAEVVLASANNLEVGNEITFGADGDTQTATITAFDTDSQTVSFAPPLSRSVGASTPVSTTPGAPASDESRGLAGVGGPDTLILDGEGRATGGFHGGFRFVLVTLTTPGTVKIAGAGMRFQAYRATPEDYEGWFLSSNDLLNRMWYAGAYTNQMNMKLPGVNGLPDARIYDGAKRDRSIWTGDLIVQAPTVLNTIGDAAREYLTSSFDVMLAQQRDDGHIPGSPDFAKGRSPEGFPLYYSNNYSAYGARAIIDYYKYTGDEDYVRGVLPALRRELAYNDSFLDENNLVVSGDRDYWQATQTGEVTKYSIDYYIVLREMAWLERQIGSTENAEANDAKADAIKRAVNDILWNPDLGAYGQSSDNPDVLVEDANALALQYDFVPENRVDDVLRRPPDALDPVRRHHRSGARGPDGPHHRAVRQRNGDGRSLRGGRHRRRAGADAPNLGADARQGRPAVHRHVLGVQEQ